jgi:hypothetical protein
MLFVGHTLLHQVCCAMRTSCGGGCVLVLMHAPLGTRPSLELQQLLLAAACTQRAALLTGRIPPRSRLGLCVLLCPGLTYRLAMGSHSHVELSGLAF